MRSNRNCGGCCGEIEVDLDDGLILANYNREARKSILQLSDTITNNILKNGVV